MKTIRELKTLDWSGYIFKIIVDILDIEFEYFMVNYFRGCKDGSKLFNLCYSEENGFPHIVFNNIECIFRKCGIYSYLIFCENNKNKNMISNYVKIIDQLKEEIISWVDEFEDDSFRFGNDFMRFRFRTDDNLVYNQKINVSVVVILLSSVIKRGNTYYLQFRLQKYFYEKDTI